VILASPVAESSLTVSGVRIVVDSGLHRVPYFDDNTSLTSLQVGTGVCMCAFACVSGVRIVVDSGLHHVTLTTTLALPASR
jgi:HrpA-like RNA helicase